MSSLQSVTISDEQLTKSELSLAAVEAEITRRHTENRLAYYKPYAKQKEFHDAGKTARERLFMAANRVGKSLCGAAEMAMHLTGAYPSWWDGRRFDRPIRAWAAGVTGETVRDVVQEKLIGPPMRKSDWGTGFIPKHCLGEVSVARGIADLIDSVSIKHISGGNSDLQFKSYAAGREKWQGVGLEVVWLDEESPADLYFEALTRTNETRGIVYTTFTPILGWSEVVRRFLTGET
jgi:phage terminase large subunit-like protein